MILDLRRLNSFVSTPRFAMEDIRKVRPLLQAGDWMTSIDLKDASIKTEQYKAKYTFCFIFCLVLFFGGLKPPPFLPAQMASPMLLRKIFLAPLASRSSVKWQVGQRKVCFLRDWGEFSHRHHRSCWCRPLPHFTLDRDANGARTIFLRNMGLAI